MFHLIGYLIATPRSKTTLFPGAGLLYLEDKKNAVICQVHSRSVRRSCGRQYGEHKGSRAKRRNRQK